MAAKDILLSAGVDLVEYKKNLNDMVSYGEQEFSKLELAAQRAYNATSGKGAGGGKGLNQIGQVSQHIQDVSVSLQSGASAATVIAQQGSQIASIFGPTGKILGGVIGLAAALSEVVNKTKEITAKVEAAEKKLAEGKAADQKVIEEGQTAALEASVERMKRLYGEEAAERLKIARDTQKKIDDIESSAASDEVRSVAIQRIRDAAEEKLAAFDERNKKAFHDWSTRVDELNAKLRELNEEVAPVSTSQKLKMMAEDYAKLVDARNKEASGSSEWIKKDIAAREKELDLRHAIISAQKEQLETAEKIRSADAKALHDLADQLDRTANVVASATRNAFLTITREATDAIKDAAREAKQEFEKAQKELEDKIDARVKSPADRRKDRDEQKRRDRAARSIDAQERSRAADIARGAKDLRSSREYHPSRATINARAAETERLVKAMKVDNLTVTTIQTK